jgi:hypothetical protein
LFGLRVSFNNSDSAGARCGHGTRTRSPGTGSGTDQGVAGHLVLRCTGLPSRSARVAPPLRLAALRWRGAPVFLGRFRPPSGVSTAFLVAVARFSKARSPRVPPSRMCAGRLEASAAHSQGRHARRYANRFSASRVREPGTAERESTCLRPKSDRRMPGTRPLFRRRPASPWREFTCSAGPVILVVCRAREGEQRGRGASGARGCGAWRPPVASRPDALRDVFSGAWHPPRAIRRTSGSGSR